MSLLQKFFSAEPAERISDFLNPQYWLTDICGGTTTSGECVNTRSSMTLAAFFACVHVLSTDVAKLPLKVYRSLSPRGKEIAYDHPMYDVLHDSPNEDMSSMSLREAMMSSILLNGNGYARIIKEQQGASKKPVGLRFIASDRVTIKNEPSKDGFDAGPVYYVVKKEGSTETQKVNAEDMIHVHGVSEDGIRGMSIIRCAAESIGVGLAAQRFGAAFFGNGSTMSGALETPLGLEDTARDNLRSSLDRLHTGAANAHRMLILEEGMKYARIGIPPEEGQFLESRQFTVEDICRWFRMPPHKIQHLLRATFSNIEEQSLEFVTDTLTPWITRFEQEYDRKLFADEEGVFCEHLVNGLLRGNAAARGAYYTQCFGIGVYSPNDIREIENMNPVDGGDDYFRPLNMQKLGEEPEPPEPAPVPPGLEQPQEQEPPEDVPAEDQAPENPPVPPDEAAKAALLPVFLGDAARVIRKESAACERACAKYKSNDEAFNLWLESFFNEDHLGYIIDTFQPTAHALCVLTNRTWSTEFKAFKRHINESKELATHRFHYGTVETIEISDRAKELSTALIEEICNG